MYIKNLFIKNVFINIFFYYRCMDKGMWKILMQVIFKWKGEETIL